MDHELFEPTIKTTIDDIKGPVENPGSLVMVASEGETTFVLDCSIIVIGSDDAADIRIEDRSIASYHAEITHDDGRYEIRHLDGSAPVRVNGDTVRESVLGDGDAVAIGDHVFSFRKPTPLQDVVADMPEEIALLVAEMLAKDPEERPTDMTTVARRLRSTLEAECAV
jgi:pSer/pThr/pTyr-binding forkhead associated (FHA) protein